MASLPVEVLLGVYLGLLTGIIPAMVAWGLGFTFKYFTGVTIPALAVVVFSLAVAGANGGLLALNDPTIRQAPNAETLIVAILVVMMMSLYAHAHGDRMGASFPRRVSLRRLRERTLSTDVVELVGGRGQVRVTVAGEVGDMEGYPPLPDDLRAEVRGKEWTFPADLPLSELEARLADKLRTEFDLAEAAVTIDERGRAMIAAAPPTAGVSKRVPPGRRAVSVAALVPTGLARGDEVDAVTDDGAIRGTVVSARSSLDDPGTAADDGPGTSADGGEDVAPKPPPASTTEGGDGRITVATARGDATRLLGAERAHVVVRSRGTHREFELLSLLRRAGKRFRKLSVDAESSLAGATIGEVSVRDAYDVVVLAVRTGEGWTVAPRGATTLDADADVFAVGTRENLDRFQEVLS